MTEALTIIVNLQQWRKPLTKIYNGFDPHERIRGWQVTWWLIDTGQLTSPKTDHCKCSICGSEKRVNYHNENYYEPWTAKLVCTSCHYFVHTRFRIDCALPVLRKRAGGNPTAEWVHGLSQVRIDLAKEMRAMHGDQIREFPALRDETEPKFPFEQLHPICEK